MTFLLNRIGKPMIVFNAEGGGSGGGEGGTGNASPSPESVLFPEEGKKEGEGGNEGQSNPPAGQSDWKEYQNDPAKTEAENAAAKVEHDKTKPADKGDDVADKVPEDGKYQVALPDGVELDAGMLEALAPEFKEMGLTNGQVQKLAGKFTEIMQKRGEDHMNSPEGAWSAAAHEYFKANGTPDKWADTAKADKEIGGDKWDATVQNATRFANKMGTPGLKEFLNKSGAGNHPELIRVFAKAGELIREDNPPSGGAGGAGKPVETAHALFPTDAPKG